jgi:hypothetical protein
MSVVARRSRSKPAVGARTRGRRRRIGDPLLPEMQRVNNMSRSENAEWPIAFTRCNNEQRVPGAMGTPREYRLSQ